MRCTAMSRLGEALTSACQSPEIRLTLNVASDGSAKVARPSNVDWLPDDIVYMGRLMGAWVAASVALLSHAMETIVKLSAPARAASLARVCACADMFPLLALGFVSPKPQLCARFASSPWRAPDLWQSAG